MIVCVCVHVQRPGVAIGSDPHTTPPITHRCRFWRRYIYLWVNYALFEELQAGDAERTREVYKCVVWFDFFPVCIRLSIGRTAPPGPCSRHNGID